MNKKNLLILFLCFSFFSHCAPQKTNRLFKNQRAFVDMRFGAFVHFGIRTFTGGAWGEPNQDISQFNPVDLDCNQWIDAFKSANMKFAILTTKHHDGFCLWDSKYTDYDVANTPWKNGKGDVVREYVNACRANGIAPGLYYSVWDATAGIGEGNEITEAQMDVILGQITELLTNYGEIPMLIMDGWSWKTGHHKVPYTRIHQLVRELQPDCLLSDHTHLRALYDVDIVYYEAGNPCPDDNTLPATLSALIYKDGGNGWFWTPQIPTAPLMTVDEVVENLHFVEPRWCSYILNCPPNDKGLMDANIVERLAAIGKAWQPNPNRPPLPDPGPQNLSPVMPDTAFATSGNAWYAIDGLNDRYYYTVWKSEGPLPQSVTLDMGDIVAGLGYLSYVPQYKPVVVPTEQGSIKEWRLYKSMDNVDYDEITHGEWNGDTKMKVITFSPTEARYLRLEAVSAVGDTAAITELAVGLAPGQ